MPRKGRLGYPDLTFETDGTFFVLFRFFDIRADGAWQGVQGALEAGLGEGGGSGGLSEGMGGAGQAVYAPVGR